LYDAVLVLQEEAGSYPAGVRTWMRVMAVSFFAGILFVRWRREALWVVLMAVATFVLLVISKSLNPDLSRSLLGSVIHLTLWPLVLYLLWSTGARNRRRAKAGRSFWDHAFLGWLTWVTALILVSLAFDARFLVSHLAGS
jgi:hypothetical protein